MTKLVFDADGLIKLAKAGVLLRVADIVEGLVPRAVFIEVMKGKEKMYDDAHPLQQLVEQGRFVVKTPSSVKAFAGLGLGERSAWVLFEDERADAIVSDDRRFLHQLHRHGIPFVIPSDLIAEMVASNALTSFEGLHALERIRPFVREENYLKAREKIG